MKQTFEPCSAPSCDRNAAREAYGRSGYCCTHYQRIRKHGDPDALLWKSPAKDWLESHVSFTGDECLIWPFHIGKDGYGRVHLADGGHLTTASRFMCILAHGDPPGPKYEAAHRCGKGNQGCCSPRHVYWATSKTNHADKITHGTTNRGERQGSSKLKETDIREIRRLLAAQVPQKDIAASFNIDPSHVSDIKRGKRWDWLP